MSHPQVNAAPHHGKKHMKLNPIQRNPLKKAEWRIREWCECAAEVKKPIWTRLITFDVSYAMSLIR
jgi:hypothetical protein